MQIQEAVCRVDRSTTAPEAYVPFWGLVTVFFGPGKVQRTPEEREAVRDENALRMAFVVHKLRLRRQLAGKSWCTMLVIIFLRAFLKSGYFLNS